MMSLDPLHEVERYDMPVSFDHRLSIKFNCRPVDSQNFSQFEEVLTGALAGHIEQSNGIGSPVFDFDYQGIRYTGVFNPAKTVQGQGQASDIEILNIDEYLEIGGTEIGQNATARQIIEVGERLFPIKDFIISALERPYLSRSDDERHLLFNNIAFANNFEKMAERFIKLDLSKEQPREAIRKRIEGYYSIKCNIHEMLFDRHEYSPTPIRKCLANLSAVGAIYEDVSVRFPYFGRITGGMLQEQEYLRNLKLDRETAELVVGEAFKNAVKYTAIADREPKAIQAVVSSEGTKQSGEVICFEFKDTGVGIPEYDLERIFKDGYRSKRTSKSVHGTGHGMSVMQEVVLGKGGRLEITSRDLLDPYSNYKTVTVSSEGIDIKDAQGDWGEYSTHFRAYLPKDMCTVG